MIADAAVSRIGTATSVDAHDDAGWRGSMAVYA